MNEKIFRNADAFMKQSTSHHAVVLSHALTLSQLR
jgi:hypothetical protein